VLLAVWSPKGGSGTSVVAAAVAVVLSRRAPARLADLAGDQPAIIGLPPEPCAGLSGWLAAGPEAPTEALAHLALDAAPGLALLPFGSGPGPADLRPEAGAALSVSLREGPHTVLDAGVAASVPAAHAAVEVADASVVVVRGCYLALRRAVRAPLVAQAKGAVLVEEPGRVLGAREVAEILGLPVLARFPVRPSIARAVDAGVLVARLPSPLLAPAAAVLDAVFALPAAGQAA